MVTGVKTSNILTPNANRLSSYINTLIYKDQTGFMPTRAALTNILTLSKYENTFE